MPATLYHAPLACSLAARIAAAEGHVPLELEYLNLGTKELQSGGSLFDVNPLGQVSVLRLEDGSVLTETGAVILWIQEHAQNTDFRVDPGATDYFQMIRWLGFCATELHKQIFRIVFYNEATSEVKDRIRELAPKRFELLDHHLSTRPYLLGDHFSAPDAYLTWFFVLSENARLETASYPNLQAYQQRVVNRPLVAELIESDRSKSKEIYG